MISEPKRPVGCSPAAQVLGAARAVRLHALARPAGLELALFDFIGLGFLGNGDYCRTQGRGIEHDKVTVRLTEQSLAELLGLWHSRPKIP